MKCPKCFNELDDTDLDISVGQYDEDCFVMILICDSCLAEYNGIMPIDSFVEKEE